MDEKKVVNEEPIYVRRAITFSPRHEKTVLVYFAIYNGRMYGIEDADFCLSWTGVYPDDMVDRYDNPMVRALASKIFTENASAFDKKNFKKMEFQPHIDGKNIQIRDEWFR